jgi:hypothetical protein
VQERVRSFHLGDSPPLVTHLIAEDTSRRGRRRSATVKLSAYP